jgi:fructose-1-phosphate kinase PfkB-like protein
VYLDASGEALRRGLAAKPRLIKPNKHEFADLVGGALVHIEDYAAAAVEIAARYETTVVLSLGADGAICAYQTKVLHARPPHVTITSAVGSGDSLLAGILDAAARGADVPEQLRCGVAAGTANALRLGAGVFTREDFDRIYANVTFDR